MGWTCPPYCEPHKKVIAERDDLRAQLEQFREVVEAAKNVADWDWENMDTYYLPGESVEACVNLGKALDALKEAEL